MKEIQTKQVTDKWIEYMSNNIDRKESFIDLLMLNLSSRELLELINSALEGNISITEVLAKR